MKMCIAINYILIKIVWTNSMKSQNEKFLDAFLLDGLSWKCKCNIYKKNLVRNSDAVQTVLNCYKLYHNQKYPTVTYILHIPCLHSQFYLPKGNHFKFDRVSQQI